MTKNQKKMFENIYDLIRGTILFDDESKDITTWGKLTRKHYNEARKEMRKFLIPKNIEWNGDDNTIIIGKHFKIQLIIE